MTGNDRCVVKHVFPSVNADCQMKAVETYLFLFLDNNRELSVGYHWIYFTLSNNKRFRSIISLQKSQSMMYETSIRRDQERTKLLIQANEKAERRFCSYMHQVCTFVLLYETKVDRLGQFYVLAKTLKYINKRN